MNISTDFDRQKQNHSTLNAEWLYMRVKDVYRNGVRPIEQQSQESTAHQSMRYRKR